MTYITHPDSPIQSPKTLRPSSQKLQQTPAGPISILVDPTAIGEITALRTDMNARHELSRSGSHVLFQTEKKQDSAALNITPVINP